MELIAVDEARCSRCGLCVEVCPVDILKMGDRGPEAIQPQVCLACGHCTAVCPKATLDNQKAPVEKQRELAKFPVLPAEIAEQYLRSRRSIRVFKRERVPRESLLQLVNMARFAPTAGNSQGISYLIVEEKELMKKALEKAVEWMEGQLATQDRSHWSFTYHVRAYREFGKDSILRDAPHLVLATAARGLPRARENTLFSLAYLELYAPALGLGSCWAGLLEMCLFAGYAPLLELFPVAREKSITGAVMVGYPKFRYQRLVDRKPLDVAWL
ncbi:hypothetical protein P22_3855 [Propionispora sp. 2/2-37]|uniref:nitroreductase family protein n=1 Tax=Propionispora sp. 2/2-37 TaxID=1677858 RepID=UPI0006BB8CEC|nr:nitroreductase family protein [Propionispora sp. 2/2-37]CUH97720.1 hypothetical protein P22_3855 [Propionispora sp. 2/2-37]